MRENGLRLSAHDGAMTLFTNDGTCREKAKNTEVDHRVSPDLNGDRLAHRFRHARHETGLLRPHLVRHLFRLVDLDDDGNPLLIEDGYRYRAISEYQQTGNLISVLRVSLLQGNELSVS